MAKAGAFDGLDAAFHHHPGPRNIAFNFQMQASMDMTIEWEGKSANAAVSPWEGRSALHASEVFTTAANCMREQILPTCRLHYFMTEGPHAVNAIPDHVKFVVRFRGENTDVVRDGVDWLKDIAKAIQKKMGKSEDGMALGVDPNPSGALMGGSTEVGDGALRHRATRVS
jgi:aminobenzoyl-glutamate utilization protein B